MELYARMAVLLIIGVGAGVGSLVFEWRAKWRSDARGRLGRLDRLPLGKGLGRANPGYAAYHRAFRL